MYDMSKEVPWMHSLSMISPRYQTPVKALIVIMIIMIAFVLIRDIERLALLTTLTVFITFSSVNLAAIVLRYKSSTINRPYRMPVNFKGFPILALLGFILTIILMIFSISRLI